MSSDENQKKVKFHFGKFGKATVREIEIANVTETDSEETLSAVSAGGKIIGSVTVVAATLFVNEVKAGATGVPY